MEGRNRSTSYPLRSRRVERGPGRKQQRKPSHRSTSSSSVRCLEQEGRADKNAESVEYTAPVEAGFPYGLRGAGLMPAPLDASVGAVCHVGLKAMLLHRNLGSERWYISAMMLPVELLNNFAYECLPSTFTAQVRDAPARSVELQ